MQNQQISKVETHKHLGIFLSSDYTWHTHIDYIKNKAWNRIHIMRKLKFKIDRKSLEIIYTTFIRPILEYADVIWDNCTQYEKQELEKIQNEAARIATGTTKLVSLNVLYKEIGWDSLEKRRTDHKLILLYKMQTNMTPSYLSNFTTFLIITSETPTIFSLYMQEHLNMLTHFSHQLSETGIAFQQKCLSLIL